MSFWSANNPWAEKRRSAFRRWVGASVALSVLPVLVVFPAEAQGEFELLTNGTFEDGLNGWNAYPEPFVADGSGCVDVPAHTEPYGAAIEQTFPVREGETYAFSADLLSEPATEANIRVVVQGDQDIGYAEFLPARKVPLGPDPQTLTATFTADRDYDAAKLTFQQDITNDTEYRFCADNASIISGAEPEAYVPETGPVVRVNQVGYLPSGPKRATVVSDETTALQWVLRDAAGTAVDQGETTPEGMDPSAGVSVHTADFSDVEATGTGFTLHAAGQASYPFAIADDLYDGLRSDAKTFFYTNRSGIAIEDDLAPGYGRAAGHIGKSPNTGDTAVGCQDLDDDSQRLYEEPWTCEGTHNVAGGWYDAGDHGKYVVNGGLAVGQLMMEYERQVRASTPPLRGAPVPSDYADGSLSIPEAGNGTPDLLDEIRWQLEWMMSMHVPPGEPYAGMAYHKVADVDWTELPLMPADNPRKRVIYRPSTAATLNLAAAAAQGSRLFAPHDPEFADALLTSARTAYDAAQQTPHLYAPAPDADLDPDPGSGPYDDDDATDELYWAAAELFLTTSESAFADDVLDSEWHTKDIFSPSGFDWGNVAALGRLDLATVPHTLADRDQVRESVIAGADGYLADQASQPFGHAYAPKDGEYAWGSNSSILNNLQVIGTAYDLSGAAKYAAGFLEGVDYIFGRNALNQSYVTGYGRVFSRNQHSRWYAHQIDPRLPNPPAGSLAGGPNSTAVDSGDPQAVASLKGCVSQFCYVDDIGSWSTNEITVNWNATMSWAAGFLADLDGDSAPGLNAAPSQSVVDHRTGSDR